VVESVVEKKGVFKVEPAHDGLDSTNENPNFNDRPPIKTAGEEREKFKSPLNTFACVIGKKLSPANYYLKDWREVPLLIGEMASLASK
jgi:hypothetical protein